MTAVPTDIETFAFWERDRAERMAAFRWLRDHDPVSWHPPAESLLLPPEENTKGFWSITKHAHIQEVSRSPVFCSGEGIFMNMLGGVTTFLGPMVGTLLLLILNDTVTRLTEYYGIALGIVILFFAIGLRKGLMDFAVEWYLQRRRGAAGRG